MDNRRGTVVVLTALGSLMAALDTLVVASALGAVRDDLHASLAQLEWTVNAYNLSLAVLLVPAAALGDRLGRARSYAGGLVLFALASAGCALASDVGVLIAMRVVQGAGAAVMTTLGLALLTGAFPPEERGAAIGLWSAVTGISVASGPLVGGAVVGGLDWQWIFWLNVPIGLVAAPLVLRLVPEVRVRSSRLDLPGVTLLAGAALGTVWALVRGEAAGWGSVEVLVTGLAGVGALGGFVAWERRAPHPLLPPRLLRVRGFVAGNVAISLTFASLFAGVFFYSQLVQVVLQQSPAQAGLRLMAWTGTFLVVAPAAGALADRVGERPLVAIGLTTQAAAMVWLALEVSATSTFSTVVGPFVIGGIGVAMAIPCGQSAVVAAVHDDDVGTASGINSTMRELGGVLGIAVTVAVFGGAGGYASAADFADGVAPALVAAAVLSALGAVAGLALPSRGRAATGVLPRGTVAA